MTNQPPLTNQQLDDIEAAINSYRLHPTTGFNCCSAHPVADAGAALVAEVRRLRAQVVDLGDENAKLIRWHGEDETALKEMRGTVERLRAERDHQVDRAEKLSRQLRAVRRERNAAERARDRFRAAWKSARSRAAGHWEAAGWVRDERDKAETALTAIRHLHKDSPMGPCPVCIDADAVAAGGDGLVPYPCPTGRLAGAKDCDPPHVRAARYEAAGNVMAASLCRDGFGVDEIADMLGPGVTDGEAPEPTLLRWGLDDVMYGDDDSTIVMLSGPVGEPYWLELDPERAAVLRQNLAGPGAEEPATEEQFAGTRQCGHDDYHNPHEWADRPAIWCPGHSIDADKAQQ